MSQSARAWAAVAGIGMAAWVAGCGGSEKKAPAPPPQGSATVGAAGGTVDGPDGVALAIAPGSLGGDTPIQITRDATGAPAIDFPLAAPIYAATPHGTSFAKDAVLRLPFDASKVPAGSTPVLLRAEKDGKWMVHDGGVIDGATLVAGVNSFSWYTVAACDHVAACATNTLRLDYLDPLTQEPIPLFIDPVTKRQQVAGLAITQPTTLTFQVTYRHPVSPDEARLHASTGAGTLLGLTWDPLDHSFWAPVQLGNATNVHTFQVAVDPAAVRGAANPGGSYFYVGSWVDAFKFYFCFDPFQYFRCREDWGVSASMAIPVRLDVAAPVITQPPADRTVAEGEAPTFSVAATGSNLSYQWYRGGCTSSASVVRLAGATGTSYSPGTVGLGDDWCRYAVEVCSSGGTPPARSCITAQATLRVTPYAAVPAFAEQPVDLTVIEGGTARFQATATGGPAPTVGWYAMSSAGPAAISTCPATTGAGRSTTASCTLASVTRAQDGLRILARAANATQPTPVDSNVVTLTVWSAPSLLSGLSLPRLRDGDATTASVVATGNPPPTSYRWTIGSEVLSCTAASCTFTAALRHDGQTLTVEVSNGVGTPATSAVVLVVLPSQRAPTITSGLQPVTVLEGAAASFAVVATGNPAPTSYTWTLGGAPLAACSAAGSSCTFTPAWTDSSASVRVVVSNGVPPDAQSSATLTVTVIDAPATILTQPQAASVVEPAVATFSVVATGTPAPTYQWQSSGDGGTTWSAIAGATAASYTTPATAVAESGRLLRVEASNLVRTPPFTTNTVTVTSGTARLDVTATPPPGNALVARAIAAGSWNSFAVATDGTVWAWGAGVDAATGQYSATQTATAPWATAPVQVQGTAGTPLAGVAAIATTSKGPGQASAYALHADGTVSAWGNNDVGQLGDGTTSARAAPVKVMDGAAPLDKACAIAAAADALVVIRSDEADGACGQGKAKRAWIAGLINGSSAGGLPPAGTFNNGAVIRPVPGLPSGVPVRQVVGKGMYGVSGSILLLLESGQVFAWGWNHGNMLGAGDGVTAAGLTSPVAPVEVTSFWSGAWDITLGWELGVTRSVGGALQAVGRNQEGQLGDGSSSTVLSRPTLGAVSTLTSAGAVSAGFRTVAAIQNGELWGWGFGWELLGLTQSPFLAPTPVRIGTGVGFTQVSTGYGHGLALGPAGVVHAWGDGAQGALGNGTTSGIVRSPTAVTR